MADVEHPIYHNTMLTYHAYIPCRAVNDIEPYIRVRAYSAGILLWQYHLERSPGKEDNRVRGGTSNMAQ